MPGEAPIFLLIGIRRDRIMVRQVLVDVGDGGDQISEDGLQQLAFAAKMAHAKILRRERAAARRAARKT